MHSAVLVLTTRVCASSVVAAIRFAAHKGCFVKLKWATKVNAHPWTTPGCQTSAVIPTEGRTEEMHRMRAMVVRRTLMLPMATPMLGVLQIPEWMAMAE